MRSRLPLWLRLAILALGIFILLWLPVEDRSVTGLLLISGCICFLGMLAAVILLNGRPGASGSNGEQARPLRTYMFYPLAGVVTGAAVTLAALLLMAIKTGLHGHGVPDYSPAQVSLILRAAPLWVSAGLIAGVVAGVLRR